MGEKVQENLHKGHRERLKNRFETTGLDDFEHHNILELLLFYAIPRIDTNEIAHNLINEFGNISEVFEARVEDLAAVAGMTKSAAVFVSLIAPVTRVYMENRVVRDDYLDTSKKIGEYFVNKFIGRTQEIVYLLCMDSSCCEISCDILSYGTVNSVNISIRKVVNLVMKHNACSVILSHNHPRGFAVASNEDVVTTKYLFDALKILDIKLLDHVIVAQKDFFSMADFGYIK